MRKLLIVANMPSQNTQALAEAALRGAAHPDIERVEATLKPPLEASAEDVLACDAILIGTTENFGAMSGLIKDFFERIYYPCLEEKQGLPYGLYIRAGLDGTGTRVGVDKIITGLRWKAVQAPVLLHGDYDDRFESQVEELAMTLAAGLDAGIL